MSDYKITKTSDNEYKVEKEIDWSSDDLEGFSKCVVCGKEFYPISKDDRCCSVDCIDKYFENKEYYDKKRESDSLADSLCVLALLAFLIWCIVDFVKLVK